MMRSRRRRTSQQTLLLLVVAVVVWAVREYGGVGKTQTDPSTQREPAAPTTDSRRPTRDAAPRTAERETRSTRSTANAGDYRVAEAFARRESDFFVTLEAEVIRLLDDDTFGDQHQNFIVRLANDMTLKVSHNIDLAPRVPIRMNDRIRLRGEYEWTEQGGVIHWTHHDPRGRKTGGWIEFDGKKYQ